MDEKRPKRRKDKDNPRVKPVAITVKPPIDRTSYGITMGLPICRWLFC